MKTFTMRRQNLIINACLFLLVVLFTYTAINKLFAINRFRFQLETFPWLNAHPIAVAWTIILTEIIIVILLISPRRTRMGFMASLILLSLFTIYLLTMFFTASSLPCTCGGVLQQLSWPQHIAVNLLFIGISILGLFSIRHQ